MTYCVENLFFWFVLDLPLITLIWHSFVFLLGGPVNNTCSFFSLMHAIYCFKSTEKEEQTFPLLLLPQCPTWERSRMKKNSWFLILKIFHGCNNPCHSSLGLFQLYCILFSFFNEMRESLQSKRVHTIGSVAYQCFLLYFSFPLWTFPALDLLWLLWSLELTLSLQHSIVIPRSLPPAAHQWSSRYYNIHVEI